MPVLSTGITQLLTYRLEVFTQSNSVSARLVAIPTDTARLRNRWKSTD